MTALLSTRRGTAMLAAGVLGPGLLVLPQLAAAAAGPVSILAWAGLLALSVPVALTFAALGARHPGSGGAAAFVGIAFGGRAAAVVGWWFYGAVPMAVLAGALVGGDYVASCFDMGGPAPQIVAGVVLAGAFAANCAGLRVSGRLQLGLVAVLVVLLAIAIAGAAPDVQMTNFAPAAPHGLAGIVRAAGVLLFAFVGWEAVSHLSADFADPERGLRRATVFTLIVVGVLYLGLAVVSIGVLGVGATSATVPLAALVSDGIGGAGRQVTGVIAVVLSFGAVNTYIAGAARLGAALGGSGALPSRFATLAGPYGIPRRSLALLAALVAAVTAPVLIWHVGLDALMRGTSACLAAVTVLGTASAARILPRDTARRTAGFATGFAGAALVCCGSYLLVPAGLAVAALTAWSVSGRGQPIAIRTGAAGRAA